MWKKRKKNSDKGSEVSPATRRDARPGVIKAPAAVLDTLAGRSVAAAQTQDDGASAPARALGKDAVSDVISRLVLDEAVPVYLSSPDGELLYSNTGFDELCIHLGASAPRSSRSGKGVPAQVFKAVRDVAAMGRSVSLQDRVNIEGEIKFFRSRHFPVCDDDYNILAVGGTYIDSTSEAKALEQARVTQAKLNDFARATSDWFWEIDEDGAITSISDRLTGVLNRPAVSFIGEKLTALGAFVDSDSGEAPGKQAISQQAPFRDQLFEVKGDGGETCLYHLSGVPVFEPGDGAFRGYRGAGTDVSARFKAERAANASRLELETALEELTKKNLHLDMASAEAETASKSKSEFLAAMSHELRTPLNAIIGFSEAMSLQVFGELNEKYTSYSLDIVNAARHLLELINDVLDVAFIDSGKLKFNMEQLDISSIIGEAFQLVVLRADDKKINTRDTKVDGDWSIFADGRRVTQIIINLFGNAVKFTPEGGAIGVDVSKAPNDHIALTIWDTGIGIAKQKQGLVFEKFQQVTDDVYSRKEAGTGLGLHISRRLARMMGGDITVQSKPGKGSRFTLTLPARDRREDQNRPQS